MRMLKLVMVVLAGAVSATSAQAQACLGFPSFAGGSVHLNGAGEFPDSAVSYAVAVSGGTHDGLFASVGGGQVSYTGLDASATLGFLEVGYQVPIRGAQLCPIAGGYLAAGPDDAEVELKSTSRSAVAGLALGVPLGPAAFRLIPNAAIRYQYASQRVDQQGIGSATEASTTGTADLGLGLVVFDRWGVQPVVHIPLGNAVGGIGYGVYASASIGRRAR